MNRKSFLAAAAIATPGFFVGPKQAPPNLDDELVKEFVTAGHGDLATVSRMLETHPPLIYARYDWGDGDYEEALEGASHVGNKDLVAFLIGRGARPNLFAWPVLGHTAIVKAMIEVYPELLYVRGAHGLSLLHHAEKGGDPAAELFDFFQARGLTVTSFQR